MKKHLLLLKGLKIVLIFNIKKIKLSPLHFKGNRQEAARICIFGLHFPGSEGFQKSFLP
jgi:hypothetical protein